MLNKEPKTIDNSHFSIDQFSLKISLKRFFHLKKHDNLTKKNNHYVINNNLYKKIIIAVSNMLTEMDMNIKAINIINFVDINIS